MCYIDINGFGFYCKGYLNQDIKYKWSKDHLIKEIEDLSAYLVIELIIKK